MRIPDIVRGLTASFALVWLAAHIPFSASAEALLDFMFKPDATFAPFRSKAARELMSEDEYQRYQVAVRKLDCDAAIGILNSAFVRAYPQFLRAKWKPEIFFDPHHEAWAAYALNEYPGYGFCSSYSSFKKAGRDSSQARTVRAKIHALRTDRAKQL